MERARAAGLAVGWAALAEQAGRGVLWCSGKGALAGAEITPDLPFDLASLTKPLATTTLLLLARRDGLELEAPLGEVLPELAASPWAAVTFLQCACHTAGFPAWAPLYALGERSAAGYLESLAGTVPAAPAGVAVVYSDLGFIAIGIALERLGGAGLKALFEEFVAEPLGIADELLFAPVAGAAAAAGEREWYVETRMLAERGLTAAPPPALSDAVSCDDGNARALSGAAGNAGLFGTAAAVARLAGEYLPGGGEILTADEAALATRCHTGGHEQARGLGWQLAATPGCSAGPALPADAFGHAGFTGTSVWVDPHDRAAFVLLGNRLHPGGRTPDLHPLRRRFHGLARRTLSAGPLPDSIAPR